MAPQLRVHTLAERPDRLADIDRLSVQSWPRFLMNGVPGWDRLFGEFAHHQVLLCDTADRLLAVGHLVPLVWDGSVADLPPTIEAILARSREDGATAFSALAAMVDPEQRGQGLSRAVLLAMKAVARRHGYAHLIAPVRPTWKARYPLAPMDRYVTWRRADGDLLDPWLRVHQKLGAQGLAVAPSTLTVQGRVADWEAWTGLTFPETGPYVVPGALQPVHIDCERDTGRYEDPNYWMRHPVEA
ncbi:hypothetical protein [Inhella gelatinilytica]|uniref:Acetyltransferase (GNAT) family protein n=1 Tax=Inhella gelatinilytica TaxID=2795030 RepID=A0A931IVK1_9BURK|nr:hypothetical protein [Inhella gelatinilytica]MBH9551790.1 hypothetical protein [Inhella gelatinilytica]